MKGKLKAILNPFRKSFTQMLSFGKRRVKIFLVKKWNNLTKPVSGVISWYDAGFWTMILSFLLMFFFKGRNLFFVSWVFFAFYTSVFVICFSLIKEIVGFLSSQEKIKTITYFIAPFLVSSVFVLVPSQALASRYINHVTNMPPELFGNSHNFFTAILLPVVLLLFLSFLLVALAFLYLLLSKLFRWTVPLVNSYINLRNKVFERNIDLLLFNVDDSDDMRILIAHRFFAMLILSFVLVFSSVSASKLLEDNKNTMMSWIVFFDLYQKSSCQAFPEKTQIKVIEKDKYLIAKKENNIYEIYISSCE